MSVEAVLARLTTILNDANISHMVVGSLASSFHGEPRQTRDIDVVVELDRDGLQRLLSRLPEELYYVPTELAKEAVARRGMFNVIDQKTGWKVDLVVRRDRPFSQSEFERRKQIELFGVHVWVASAEDTLLAKLEWHKESPSERQLRDARGILAVSGEVLDLDYIDRWASELGLAESWRQLRQSG